MQSIEVGKLHTKGQWEELIASLKQCELKDVDGSLNVFGEGDDIYLVVNLYQSDSCTTEYVFKSNTEENPRAALFSLLENKGFSLASLLELITTANYVDEEMGEVLISGQIKIFREQVTSS